MTSNAPYYSTAARRSFLRSQEHRYRRDEKGGFSLRDVALDVQGHFDLDKTPSPATIRNDFAWLDQKQAKTDRTPEAEELIKPENFPQWRAMMFLAPKGKPYGTPKHQFAWFWLIVSLALKIDLPQWVVDYFKALDVDVEEWGISHWKENMESLMTLWILAPPRHGKTDLFLHAMIWLMIYDPNIRILWCGGSLDISEVGVEYIKMELESNERLIEWYGPFQSEGSWSREGLTVAGRTQVIRAPSLKPVGKNSTVLSRDADIIIVDDFIDIRSAESPAQTARDVRWVKSQLMTRREPWTPVLGIGSHQPSPYGDAYSEMESGALETPIHFIKMKAHDMGKCLPGEIDEQRHGAHCLLWHEERPYWFLEEMRKTLGDIMFYVCYNQEPLEGRIQTFREPVVRARWPEPKYDQIAKRFADLGPGEQPGVLDYRRSVGRKDGCCQRGDPLLRALGFDPGGSDTAESSETALTILSGCRHCMRLYVEESWSRLLSPELHTGEIAKYARQYHPKRVRIEANAYQRSLARDTRLSEESMRVGFIVDEWTTDERKWDYDLGIPMLARFTESGRLSVPFQHPQDRQAMEPLLQQMIRFPKRPTDRIMSLWLAYLSVIDMIEQLKYATPETMPGYERLPQYLKDQAVTIDLDTVTDDEEYWGDDGSLSLIEERSQWGTP
jgi:hypothetical protein